MKTIGISPPLKSSGLRKTLDALGELLNVRFEERTFRDDAGLDAWVIFEADREIQHCLARSNCPCYIVIESGNLVPCGSSSTIEFARHHALPQLLTGRRVKATEAAKLKSLPRHLKGMAVLASKADAPIWALQEIGGRQHYYVATSLPELQEGESLFQYFSDGQFLQLLPLIIFLRTLTDYQRWEQPPLRACFMFDDPNLHWRTYGYVDFAEIAAHAQQHNYHACFATIPLDTWFVHKPTALLFQQYRDQISLLIHGNDHMTQELAKSYSDEEISNILRQALSRIEEFERCSGVEVSKVMAPPHGACNERTLSNMANIGFEAACISGGSLRHYNSHARWLRTLGMQPSDMIAGLTVFHRFRISSTCHNSMLIAALLDQPIIPVGHHHDLAEGLQLLADLAGFVNSLGTVHWTDMKRISRFHYARRHEGKILKIRMFSKRIEVCVPEGTSQILVELPRLQGPESMPLAWKSLSDGSEWSPYHPDDPIPVLPGQRIEIVSGLPTSLPIATKDFKKLQLWPVVRRQLTEARDRLAPVLRRVSTFTAKLS